LLTLFAAEPRSGAIELRWQFSDLSDEMDVRLERSQAADGPWTIVTPETRREAGVTVAIDGAVDLGHTYWYRLLVGSETGPPVEFGRVSVTAGSAVQRFELTSIWPNPSKDQTCVDFSVAKEANLRLSVVDIMGREVAALAQGSYRPGRYHTVWDGHTSGGPAPAGMYFVRYQVAGKVMVRRLVLAR